MTIARAEVKAQHRRYPIMANIALIHDLSLHGLTAWRLHHGQSSALVCAQGAQVLEYGWRDEPSIIWNNPHASFVKGQPIRGGVPVCWPWFTALESNPLAVRTDWEMTDAPFHGLLRQCRWQLESQQADEHGARLCLRAPAQPHGLEVRLRLHLSDTGLELGLEVYNPGQRVIAMCAALHSYYAVSEVSRISLQGFAQAHYQDNLAARARHQQCGEPCIDGPIERVYQGLDNRVSIDDPLWQRKIHIHTRDSRSAVLWNPGAERAANLDQFAADAWPGMLCIETCRVQDDLFSVAAAGRSGFGMHISRERYPQS
ncbi:D-hexose-6-phosphate mutarotase [Pseudomonas putida]|uniref:D-hexose-6-phosphate mutarotase n=1 Tax=Pseudomonas putida TaxID=303 RepID=UPI000C9CD3F8|nr:D-hexose-6-phosphate mutarotase [Pseudomonas putida]PNG87606.1 putative glucose-6-phosphate 1-epimerase [Pseudomonas putida]